MGDLPVLPWQQNFLVFGRNFNLRLHERFLSGAGDAIFFRFCRVACACDKFWRQMKAARIAYFKRPGHYKQLQDGYTGKYLCDFVAKVSTLATLFLRFFHPSRRQFKGGYTCDFHLALATRQSLKKSHHQREQKIAHVAAALGP